MLDLIRFYTCTILMNIIFKIGLPLDRGYATAMLDAFENIPLEIEKGRTWGVIIVPWGTSDEARLIAVAQKEELVKKAITFRKKAEIKK